MGKRMRFLMVSLTGYMKVCHFFRNVHLCVYAEDSKCLSVCKTISEEVFASNGAIWWSSTGRFLAYAEFNDTEVQKVEFSWYGSDQYPQTVAVPYPKVRFSCACLNMEYKRSLAILCTVGKYLFN